MVGSRYSQEPEYFSLWELMLTGPATILYIMSTSRKNKITRSTEDKERLHELELMKAELELLNSSDQVHDFVLTKDARLIKFIAADKTYNLKHEAAFSVLLSKLDVKPGEIGQQIGYILEDLTEDYLPHAGQATFIECHRLLTCIRWYFNELLIERDSFRDRLYQLSEKKRGNG